MNYGEFKALVINYMQINDADFNVALPYMVKRTQKRLRSLRVPEKERRTFAVSPNDYLELPADFEEALDVWPQTPRNPLTGEYDDDYPKGVYPAMKPVSWSEMLTLQQRGSGGPPQYYARTRQIITGTSVPRDVFVFWPSPITVDNSSGMEEIKFNYEVNMTYYHEPAELINDSDTNAYIDDFDDLMLYGTVAEGYRWLRSEEQQGIWEQMFQNLYSEVEEAGRNSDKVKERERQAHG